MSTTAHPDPAIEELHRELRDLRRRLESVESRLPPAGWEPNGYTSIVNPADSLCRDCVTGRWSVWRTPIQGGPIAEGATAAEAVARVPK